MMRTLSNSAYLALAGLACASLFGCGDGDDASCDQSVVGNICTIAGSTENGYDGDDGPALEALLSFPQDTLTASDGTLYLLDWNNHRIRRVVDGVIQHVAGRGELGVDEEEGKLAIETKFRRPFGIEFDREGNLYVSDTINSRIVRIAR